jgi:hypothetical protein
MGGKTGKGGKRGKGGETGRELSGRNGKRGGSGQDEKREFIPSLKKTFDCRTMAF